MSNRLSSSAVFVLVAAGALLGTPALGQWVTFVDETESRIVALPSRGIDDVEEKSYSWGDVDHDGDIDVAVGRKQPWSTPGKRSNVLFLNENGVLVDRTLELATASDVPFDQGFRQLTNNRAVLLVDVDLDGWLDLVTAPTISPDDPKHIGYPRVYHNQGCSGACSGTADWLGFRFENHRIPPLLTDGGASGFNPCFNDVQAGDIDGDGYPELWFSDSDTGENCGVPGDFNNKLLLNQGAIQPGFFTDVSEALVESFGDAAFATSGGVLDLNDDGLVDLLKQSSGVVSVAYNSEPNPFQVTNTIFSASTYFVTTGDLNHDDRPDLITSNDDGDRYLLNTDVGGEFAVFTSFLYSFSHQGSGGPSSDDGFGGNSVVADLDNDGWDDVLITDVDWDAQGCDRRMHIYRNLGGSPGGNVVLEEKTQGHSCINALGNPATCIVASIPANELEGVHSVAVFDLDGDGWKDLVLGRCIGTRVLMNQPPTPAGSAPDGEAVPGTQLLLGKSGANNLMLSWGASCSESDSDFEVYEGALGAFASHEPLACTTGGAETITLTPGAGQHYYLVVPTNGIAEGSYGTASDGSPRPPSSDACRPQNVGACE